MERLVFELLPLLGLLKMSLILGSALERADDTCSWNHAELAQFAMTCVEVCVETMNIQNNHVNKHEKNK